MTTRRERRQAREERRREEKRRKRAVKILESLSEPVEMTGAEVDWSNWQKLAANSMARGYNLRWKMGNTSKLKKGKS